MSATGAALISGGFNLLGGLIGNKQRKKDAYNNSPAGIRKNAEAAGFNPLLFAGPSVNSNAGYAPVMGTAIANAGSAIAGSIMDNEELKIQQAALAMDREQLDREMQAQTLTPNVGGIYMRNPSTNGGQNASTTQDDTGYQRGGRLTNVSTPYGDLGVNEEYTPSEGVEDEYGDAASWLYGGIHLVDDVIRQGWRTYSEREAAGRRPRQSEAIEGPSALELEIYGASMFAPRPYGYEAPVIPRQGVNRPSKWAAQELPSLMGQPEGYLAPLQQYTWQ